jgi:hypothetical protein
MAVRPRVRASVLVLLAGVLSAAGVWVVRGLQRRDPAPAVAAPAEPCRGSDFAAFERSSEGVPGEQNPVVPGVDVEVSTSSGSGSSTTLVTLHDLRSDRRLEASFEVGFDRMVNPHPVPEGLDGAADRAAWLRMLEDAAFEKICAQMDPSLERLLSPEERLHWYAGEPKMPTSYAVFRQMPVPGDSQWIEYLGANHRRLGTDSLSDQLEVVDRRGDLQLLRSGHGAVVRDFGRGMYAWIYVYGGGRKLRWPSVIGGKLDGDSVLLTLDDSGLGEGKRQMRIDLSSGAMRPAS